MDPKRIEEILNSDRWAPEEIGAVILGVFLPMLPEDALVDVIPNVMAFFGVRPDASPEEIAAAGRAMTPPPAALVLELTHAFQEMAGAGGVMQASESVARLLGSEKISGIAERKRSGPAGMVAARLAAAGLDPSKSPKEPTKS